MEACPTNQRTSWSEYSRWCIVNVVLVNVSHFHGTDF